MKVRLNNKIQCLFILVLYFIGFSAFAQTSPVDVLRSTEDDMVVSLKDYKERVRVLEEQQIRLNDAVKKLESRDLGGIETLEKVNSFYTNSFSSLQNMVIAIIAFIGVILPISISYYQSRKITMEKESLEKDIVIKINKTIEDMKAEILKDHKDTMTSIELEFSKAITQLKVENTNSLSEIKSDYMGLLLHNISAGHANNNEWKDFFEYAFKAVISYTHSKNNYNLGRILSSVNHNLQTQSIEKENLKDNEILYEEFIKAMRNYALYDAYLHEVEEIEKSWSLIIIS